MWFSLFVTAVGVFMAIFGFYIKRKMMIAESSPSPKQEEASEFIDDLTKIAGGNFWRVFQLVQGVLVLGIIIAICGIASLLARV